MDSETIKAVTQAMRNADKLFTTVGGSTRHYVQDCFLPELMKLGYMPVEHGLEWDAETETWFDPKQPSDSPYDLHW